RLRVALRRGAEAREDVDRARASREAEEDRRDERGAVAVFAERKEREKRADRVALAGAETLRPQPRPGDAARAIRRARPVIEERQNGRALAILDLPVKDAGECRERRCPRLRMPEEH